MKKILLIVFTLSSAVMFGQSLPLDFEDGTTSANFQFGSLGYANIANPDISGINTSSRVLEVNKPDAADWFAGFGYETPGSVFIDLANGTAFTMKVWAPIANQSIRFQIQIGLNSEPTYNRDVVISTANVWTEVIFDFSNQPGLTGTEQYTTLVIQPNYDPACEGASCTTVGAGNGGIWYIDDIVQVGAPEPTCDDGVQNGDETGVDCGGPDCAPCPESCDDGILNNGEEQVDCGGPNCEPCPPADPTDGPDNNGSTGSDFYIYSELSGNPNSSDFSGFNLVDFAGSVTISQPDLNGDIVLKAENLDYFGSGFGESFNATATYSYVHLNYYATTSTAWNFSLVDQSLSATICCGNPEEPFFRFGVDGPLETGQWVSVFIPLDHFANFPALVSGTWDGTDLIQTLVTGNGTVFIDNIFFSTTNVLSNDEFTSIDFKVFPNPTKDSWNVVSNAIVSEIQVLDVLGKNIFTLKPNTAISTIDAQELPNGLYFAKITTEKGSETIRLVKSN
ncbi:T9SS type A sorting domain-containing protein [Mangrovimonas spongiae]|uniref:T9SS C-terminal target domain-containing protein n=1 Tax=Mangrovimonas spongiae TaxID=2494697 RepID=A0A428K4T6_9FLAO|nr:T9SS type A sorting domain-containing protein [Mangrovimonas spongiae]RSK41425.1 T9SS C-terminal target domain-containing protein [Mangrovimonas spongiae]